MTGEDGMNWIGEPVTGDGGKGTCCGVGIKGERDERFEMDCRVVPETERRDISPLLPMLNRFSKPNLGYDTGGNACENSDDIRAAFLPRWLCEGVGVESSTARPRA